MIPVLKYEEPEDLKRLRLRAEERGLSPKEAYVTLRGKHKAELRNRLLKEQGHLCAYCMCPIPRDDAPEGISPTVIEHYVPRDPLDHRDVGQGLDYYNLLITCHGNKGPHGLRRGRDLTCDAHRGNEEFRVLNPMVPETLKTIEYTTSGRIFSKDEDVNHDLDILLNLNAAHSPLIRERRAALDALIAELGTVAPEDLQSVCRSYLMAFEEEEDPKTPYQGILVWYLRSFL